MSRYYAGIGSRETPDDILVLMESIGYSMAKRGWYLRSGGADGADTAFLEGAMKGMDPELLEPWPDIYLPWREFNGHPEGPWHNQPYDWAFPIAAEHHPAWGKLSRGARLLMARNVHQVLGSTLDGTWSEFIVCWTKNAKIAGGTGQALRIADRYEIPVYNLASEDDTNQFLEEYPLIPR